jgi:glycosyltransferase involved in cell wall biosynthesis
MRAYLHAEGVLPRVRFLGQMSDVSSVLEAIDVYLAAFPDTSARGVMEAMGAGKPVVALQYPAESPYNTAAELVGIPELLAGSEASYLEIANRLIRDAETRMKYSTAVYSRFIGEFDPAHLGPRYLQFLNALLKR